MKRIKQIIFEDGSIIEGKKKTGLDIIQELLDVLKIPDKEILSTLDGYEIEKYAEYYLDMTSDVTSIKEFDTYELIYRLEELGYNTSSLDISTESSIMHTEAFDKFMEKIESHDPIKIINILDKLK